MAGGLPAHAPFTAYIASGPASVLAFFIGVPDGGNIVLGAVDAAGGGGASHLAFLLAVGLTIIVLPCLGGTGGSPGLAVLAGLGLWEVAGDAALGASVLIGDTDLSYQQNSKDA